MGTVIPFFIHSRIRRRLSIIADSSNGWTPGRQNTGYETLSLKQMVREQESTEGSQWLNRYVCIALKSYIGEPYGGSPVNGQWDGMWDCHLIRYPNGTYIPKHKDECALQGRRHRRLNALVQKPELGGELVVDGEIISLAPGDAFLFYPDEEEHEVLPVSGTRLMLSIGAWI